MIQQNTYRELLWNTVTPHLLVVRSLIEEYECSIAQLEEARIAWRKIEKALGECMAADLAALQIRSMRRLLESEKKAHAMTEERRLQCMETIANLEQQLHRLTQEAP